MHRVELGYDTEKKQWRASYCEAVAFGDTPEMACDNFDHLWLYGEPK